MLQQHFPDIDRSWTLFLDRDGVINTRIIDQYVSKPKDFHFIEGVFDALVHFKTIFGRIVIVTNQQGISKGLMSEAALKEVHAYMLAQIEATGGHIDQVYYCKERGYLNPPCRKPNPGMAHQALADFPDIDFHKSVMVGDFPTDILFGQQLGMKTVWIKDGTSELGNTTPDLIVSGLRDLV